MAFRLPAEDKERLDALLENLGISLGQWVKRALNGQPEAPDARRAFLSGFRAGLREGIGHVLGALCEEIGGAAGDETVGELLFGEVLEDMVGACRADGQPVTRSEAARFLLETEVFEGDLESWLAGRVDAKARAGAPGKGRSR